MLQLKNVTLIAVTSVRVQDAIWALRYSSREIEFAQVKLLTDLACTDEQIEIVPIEKLDRTGYSKFVIYELHKYFDTDFALLVQDDGYVVNPSLWNDSFLEYDYIGAPWPDLWYHDEMGKVRRVGNGGFSLRSKTLCRLASELELPWRSFNGYYNEDAFICAYNAHIYEKNGCRIAPLEVARHFSQESDVPENEGIVPFGFHGCYSKYNVRLARKIANSVRRIKTIYKIFKGLKAMLGGRKAHA